jgi:hypothetical protein
VAVAPGPLIIHAIKNFLDSGWYLALILGALGFLILRSALRLARLSASESKITRGYTDEVRTNAPFRRRDFAAKAEIVRKETGKGTVIAMAILVVWCPSLVAITRLVPTISRGSLIAYTAILFVAAMASFFVFTARGSRLARLSGLICPGCGMDLTGTSEVDRFRYVIEDRVLETGKCPGCNKQLIDSSEVGPVSQSLTRADKARYMGLVGALVVGIIVMVYYGTAMVDAKAWARCRTLYDGAYNSSDSVAIDSTTLEPRNHTACGYFRRSHDQ